MANSNVIGSESPNPPDSAGDAELYVVGIGASAGGLTALRTLFGEMAPNPGLACVVVVHLSPEHDSHFVELLQPYTQMRVRQVTQTVPLEPNHVYVIPPNANLDTIDTHLRLSPLEARRRERAPIDHFLRTLAATHGDRAIAVILTGSGSDGALGLRQIKERGGLTIAQDPREAEYESMPYSAIATGMVDLVLPLQRISHEIAEFCATLPRVRLLDKALEKEEEEEEGQGEEVAVLGNIVAELERRTDRDFKFYRRTPMLRRIRRRMQLRHVETLNAYLALLRNGFDEATALADDLLLTVSEFFRDAEVFDRLEKSVLPRLFSIKSLSTDRIRVWSLGCSTGEEAYSLAILLLERAGLGAGAPRIQVFASDLSAEMLNRAREGLYPHEIAATVSAERLNNFFTEEADYYRVAHSIREIVVFAEHSLFRDPPYAHLDLIVCRNLLADLRPEMRRAVLGLFHYSLEPHGVLVVAPHDRVDEPTLFEADERQPWLLRRVDKNRDRAAVMSAAWRARLAPPSSSGKATTHARRDQQLAAVHHRLVERYTPSSVLVNASNRVVHYSSAASRYLLVPGGELTHEIFALLRQPLKSVLRPLLERARERGRRQFSSPMTVETPHGPRHVVIHVEPPTSGDLTLIVFEELGLGVSNDPTLPGFVAPADTVAQLIAQIETMERRVQGLVTAGAEDNDDLAQTNEALASANEELRSLLEEFEASKEELQAANEELTTLDRENRRRLTELGRLSADLRNLFESTGIATLFLDRDLRIVRFTPQIADLFNVRATDVGRALTDITHTLRYPDFVADVRIMLEHLTIVEREVSSRDGRWYLTRIRPYRAPDDTVDGVVVTFVDITDRKRAEEDLKAADRRKDEFLALLAHELRNPLAPIMAGIEVLKMAATDPAVVEQITTTMARQSRQLVRLVDDLLDISRFTGGRLQLRKSRVRLSDVVRDAVAAVKPLIERKRHALAVEVAAEPVILDADGARLTQVVANLLTNAARYTPDGGKIAVNAVSSGSDAVVTVADNGIGIARDSFARIFEMFYQGDDARLPRAAGLGIGLTLARSLVEMHGGTIDVESGGPDQGSRFTVRLPIVDALPDAETAIDNERELGGHRVLIVDDNADAARTLALLVRTIGENEVLTAANGPEALRMAEELRPDIVLLDLKMPGMDGYEVARQLRREAWGKEMTLIAVTGWALEEHRRRSKEAGFDRHLTKPADVASLEAVLAGRYVGAHAAAHSAN